MADIFNFTDTWNAGGTTFNAIKVNVTDTASAAGSMLADLQIGGASKLSVTKGGLATLAGGVVATTGTFSGQLIGVGTTTNDNAAAGQIGEYISSEILIASQVALTTSTAADITSISLTAGDWDVYGNVQFSSAAGTVMTNSQMWANTVSATLPTVPNAGAWAAVTNSAASQSVNINMGRRYSLAVTTTIYLSARSVFSVSTLAAYGFIGARRVR
jgi:hypothetical protein